jgi:rubrerythrin
MEKIMSGLKGTNTEQNLKDAFAGESQANRRYLYFAAKADVEGHNDVAAVFRSNQLENARSIVVSLKNRLVPPSRFLRDTTMLRAFSN